MKPTGPGQYAVTGKLTVRDVTREVTVPFAWAAAADGKSAKLVAKLSISGWTTRWARASGPIPSGSVTRWIWLSPSSSSLRPPAGNDSHAILR